MTQAELAERLLTFIRKRFLDDDPASRLDGETPLLDWGILNSVNTAELIGFVRSEFDCTLHQSSVNVRNFRNANSIATLILETTMTGRGQSA
ncbi:acyl carrier protein [Nocardia otitidiscaviarum]|uniref:Acyl carrier protein n=1 Tax=Nocardia otitidiscaviarum TaxID=1823 RepID=A0A516NME3_9NOCA|nr:acyl carrier protein [Nocardia otitidiscaviarum]MCP9624664.1 acyl carrier protein [Nocardia otitidiscaviarum]QDP80080.1 acyl carrier protein [Nocardia otitidiscaviarum]